MTKRQFKRLVNNVFTSLLAKKVEKVEVEQKSDYFSHSKITSMINKSYNFKTLTKCKIGVARKKDLATMLINDINCGKCFSLFWLDEKITSKNEPLLLSTYNLLSVLNDTKTLTVEHQVFYKYLCKYFEQLIVNTQFYYYVD